MALSSSLQAFLIRRLLIGDRKCAMILTCFVFVFLVAGIRSHPHPHPHPKPNGGLIEFLRWKQINYELPGQKSPEFTFPETPLVDEEDYMPYNNVPMGVSHFKGRLFITLPRRNPGIVGTLNVVNITNVQAGSSPKLTPYPNFDVNQLPSVRRPELGRLVSVYRTRVDSCNRLWFIDTGMLEYPNNHTQVQQPSIWVINLLNDEIIKRYEIPESIVNDGRGLPSITVDVDESKCDEAYAYIPDLFHRVLYVYSFKENHIWTFHHNFFSFDPLWGDFTIAGQSFQWNDGIFSITLGKKNPDGFRIAYFHAMVSTSEFAVSTKVLRNESNALRSDHGNDFKHLGFRGPWTQSTTHDFDPKTGVIFYTEIEKYGVGCWNTNKRLTMRNRGVVQQDEAKMIYPSDLKVDQEGTLWVMTNSLPLFIHSHLNPLEYNFRVWKQDTSKATEGTVCSA